jgi:hypothetical protein
MALTSFELSWVFASLLFQLPLTSSMVKEELRFDYL